MDTVASLAPPRRATPERPLLGLTLLAVEDSRYTCEALRLMCLRSGARLRRADCLLSARRHLHMYRPSAALVDLGLPDGSGLELIAELAAARPRLGALIAISGDVDAAPAARRAGADGFLSKPVHSLRQFQEVLLAHFPQADRARDPGPRPDMPVCPDPLALADDLTHAANLLHEARDASVLEYVAQFLISVARAAGDRPLAAAAQELASHHHAVDGNDGGRPLRETIRRLRAVIEARRTSHSPI